MLRTFGVIAPLCLLVGAAPADAARSEVDHELTVDVRPEQDEVRVHDRITLPAGVTELVLSDRAGTVSWDSEDVREREGNAGQRRFELTAADTRTVETTYILPLAPLGPGESGSAGDGITWGGGEAWYAHAPGRMLTFSLTVTVPEQWQAISQGARVRNETIDGARRVVWREMQPQRQAYLIAGPFTEYVEKSGEPRLMAFLRQPDGELADRYLHLAARYIEMYEELIGVYPYAKFALVENTRETGYGMPSFTLLGPRVIRLPFIPYTSYPHEILHNWWGNSVYVDHASGNWSEGLTAYLADHWLKEQRGRASGYRRDALQKYRNFVSGNRDFPLSQFRSGHSDAMQAVGYNKSLMLFHMLRRRVGDSTFFAALQRFYQDYRFEIAGFGDLRKVFERVSGQQLAWFFDQWVTRTGGPRLALDDVRLVSRGSGVSVRGRIRQIQPGAAYRLDVPIRVTGEAGSSRHRLELGARERRFEIELAGRPASIAVDPEFDLFRQLHGEEIPASLGAAFGAARLTFVVPRDASDSQREAYEAFARRWRNPDREVRVVTDQSPLPVTGAVWLLGWENDRRPLLENQLRAHDVSFEREAVELAGQRYERADSALVLAARAGEERPLLWSHLAGSDPAAMARRLRHYNRVSYVAFEDAEPASRGQWPVLDSPLMVRFP